uniref:Uncharacterized protein n=1 Tax=Panagrolaimus sp. ES5 TaxID=591445 RepID=A0AC34GLC1_9BILA
RKVFDALELDDPRMLREAMTSKKDILDPNNYGVKECKEFIPHFLADVKDFETDLSQMKRFFVSSGLHHPEYFNKMEHLIENVKKEVGEHDEPLSTVSSMASLLTSESSENAVIAYSTKNSCFAPSTSEKEEDLEIEVSRSATTRSNSEASLLSLAASDSTQTSSAVCDSVASTQASSS